MSYLINLMLMKYRVARPSVMGVDNRLSECTRSLQAATPVADWSDVSHTRFRTRIDDTNMNKRCIVLTVLLSKI